MRKTSPVTFDERSFLINGERVLLIMGEIHYARSPREAWAGLLDRSVEAGLNCIAAYVFWNWHEVERGVYDFSGDHDLAYFLELCAERGLYVLLRAGPYCCAEWNYGGYPPYLRNEPGITIRTWNEPYLRRVERYFGHLVPEFRPFLATNGGPIILVQVENEYANVAKRYGAGGQRYLAWMGELARELGVDVPVIMCEGGVEGAVETLNGFSIWDERAEIFRKEHPGMPLIWTELWPSWYNTWGYEWHLREARNIGYHILAFVGQGGAGWNYYMWHGGTNLGRTSMYLGVTSYDFDSPLDEFGRETLKSQYVSRLHKVLAGRAAVFLEGERKVEMGKDGLKRVTWKCGKRRVEIEVDIKGRKACLWEQGRVVFDSEKDFAQTERAFRSPAWKALPGLGGWQTWREPLPAERDDEPVFAARPVEQLLLTNDATDYCWYSTEVTLRRGGEHVLEIPRAGDVLSLFVDGKLVDKTAGPFLENRGPTRSVPESEVRGSAVNALEMTEGNYRQKFRFQAGKGRHRIDILAAAIGMIKGDWMVSGPMHTECKGIWSEVRCDGREVKGWEMRPGLVGEQLGVDQEPAVVAWGKAKSQPCAWHRAEFALTKRQLTAEWDFQLDAKGLGKGMLFLNGHALGRHWLIVGRGYGQDESWHNKEVDGLSTIRAGEPTQRYYHLPRAWVAERNVLVVFEEEECALGKVRVEARNWAR